MRDHVTSPAPVFRAPLGRRRLLVAGVALATGLRSGLLGTGAAHAAADPAADPRLAIRAAGDPKAPASVQEWFSLDCSHCARFSQEVFPEIKSKLIDTGKLYYVFHDFPLSRVALMAAAVARALPTDQYLPFIDALFASQDRWAFAPGADPRAELKQFAALAGMAPATFDATVADTDLQKAIIAEQDRGQKKYGINATPTFIFGGKAFPGEMTYQAFADHVAHPA